MIILRKKTKSFADPNSSVSQDPNNQLTSKDLAIENMKMQRQLMLNQRMRQQLQAKERADQVRQISKMQKNEEARDEQETKNQIKVKKIEQDRDEAKNVGLYKTKSKPVPPVPMKT